MNLVEVSTEDISREGWVERLERFADRVLRTLEIDNWEVSILLCTDRYIQDLNRTYRGRDEATDVLSFALYADGEQNDFSALETYGTITAGDIVISMETLERQAAEFGVSREEELKRLVIHGTLHLKGMDHASNDTNEEKMLQMQEQILFQLSGDTIF